MKNDNEGIHTSFETQMGESAARQSMTRGSYLEQQRQSVFIQMEYKSKQKLPHPPVHTLTQDFANLAA